MYYYSNNRNGTKRPPSDKDFLNKMPMFVAFIVLALVNVATTLFLRDDLSMIFEMFSGSKLGVGMLIVVALMSTLFSLGLSYLIGYIFASWFRSLTRYKIDIYYKHFINIYLWFEIVKTLIMMLVNLLLLFFPQIYYLVIIAIEPIVLVLMMVGMIWYIKRAYVTEGYYNHLVIKGISIPILMIVAINIITGLLY